MKQVKCDSTKHANRAKNKLKINKNIFLHMFHPIICSQFLSCFFDKWLIIIIHCSTICLHTHIYRRSVAVPFHLHDTHFLSLSLLNEATTKVISNFSLNAFYADIFLYFAAAVIFFPSSRCCFSSFESIMNAWKADTMKYNEHHHHSHVLSVELHPSESTGWDGMYSKGWSNG